MYVSDSSRSSGRERICNSPTIKQYYAQKRIGSSTTSLETSPPKLPISKTRQEEEEKSDDDLVKQSQRRWHYTTVCSRACEKQSWTLVQARGKVWELIHTEIGWQLPIWRKTVPSRLRVWEVEWGGDSDGALSGRVRRQKTGVRPEAHKGG